MTFRDSARMGGGTLAVLSAVVTLSAAHSASAQTLERDLAGIHLGSRSITVLQRYGNPNDVVIGDIGIRQAPLSGGGPTSGQGGGAPSSPAPGGFGGSQRMGGGSLPAPPGFGGSGGGGGGMGTVGTPGMADESAGRPAPSMGGGPPGGFGAPGGFGGLGGGGGAAGGFGQTVSPLSNEQEVTWVYNRKNGNSVVSYEFLIGPAGEVAQIRVSGYLGSQAKTKRGIVLGSTYKDVVRAYGQPEDYQQVGNVLIASYKQKAHVAFQFLNQSGQTDAYHSGYKVIAVTIAQVD
jgi:hypothetical protein